MDSIYVGDAKLDLAGYAITANAILGIRNSGKTYLAKSISEQLLDFQVPLVVFDPIGVWRHMRRGATKNDPGYAIVVAGGEEPDLPLTVESAPQIIRAAIAHRVSVVIDLYDAKLSKADWRRIVQACFHVLMYENKGVRHIVLEEAAEFIPQSIQDGQTYAAVEKVVRMGGNKSLGITLVNQRAQEVNKACLDLCDNLFLLRQRGKNSIAALSKWMESLAPKEAAQFAKMLPDLGTGDVFVFRGDNPIPIHTHGQKLTTFHPDRRKPNVTAAPPRVSVDHFVESMTEELSAVTAAAQENDPKLLKAEIVRLRQELVRSRPVAEISAREKRLEDLLASFVKHAADTRALLSDVVTDLNEIETSNDRLEKLLNSTKADHSIEPEKMRKLSPATVPRGSSGTTIKANFPAATLPLIKNAHERAAHPAVELKILDAILCLNTLGNYEPSNAAVGLFAGYTYTKGGGFGMARSSLSKKGLINYARDVLKLTDAGRELAVPPPAALTNRDVQSIALSRLDGAPRKILEALIAAYPNGMSNEELGLAVNYTYTKGGGFGMARSTLSKLGLIDYAHGTSKASPDLFPFG